MSNPLDTSNRGTPHHEKLIRGMVVLETLAYCREEARQPNLGILAEGRIVRDEMDDLERQTRLDEIIKGLGEEEKSE
jgi:hypothetical protein